MSDFEKNENEVLEETSAASQEPEDNAEPSAETENQPTELEEELEGIRTKFQEILDETAQTYLAGGDIQGYEDEEASHDEEEKEEIAEEDLCECCGEKMRDKSHGESYPYCEDCRELMQHFPIAFKGIFAFICLIVLIGVSIFYVFGNNATLIDSALSADSAFREGKIYTALETYGTTLKSYASNASTLVKPTIPKKLAARYAKTYASLLNYNYAYSVVSEFFTEKDLKNPAYKSLNEYTVKNDCYTKIMETINENLQSGKDKDEICQLLEKLKEEEGSDEFLIEYYEYIVIQYLGETPQKQYEILTELTEKYPDKWPLKYELCAVCAKLGKAEEAEDYLNEVVKHNSEDGAIYAYLADAYRFCEEPDADKMLEAIEKGVEADGEGAYSATDLNRVKAIAYLIKGDYDAAYDAAAQAYQTASSSLYYGYSVNNIEQCLYTYQLCAQLKKDDDAVEEVNSIFGYVGMTMSEDIKKFNDGKATLIEILTDGEGDLA